MFRISVRRVLCSGFDPQRQAWNPAISRFLCSRLLDQLSMQYAMAFCGSRERRTFLEEKRLDCSLRRLRKMP